MSSKMVSHAPSRKHFRLGLPRIKRGSLALSLRQGGAQGVFD
jgi:hypothetical protein